VSPPRHIARCSRCNSRTSWRSACSTSRMRWVTCTTRWRRRRRRPAPRCWPRSARATPWKMSAGCSTSCSGNCPVRRTSTRTANTRRCAAAWSSFRKTMSEPTGKTSTRLRLGRIAPGNAQPPQALPQFAHVTRYWDQEHSCFAARLLPGEYYVTRHAENMCTVLGSCVSACIRDARLRIGGMNHFMLPLDASNGESTWGAAVSAATRYGNVAMERLINDILKFGGRRQDLEIKLVGGGRVLAEMSNDVGARNIEFVREYVRAEGFRVLNED